MWQTSGKEQLNFISKGYCFKSKAIDKPQKASLIKRFQVEKNAVEMLEMS